MSRAVRGAVGRRAGGADPGPAAALPARQGRCRQGLRQCRQPRLPASPWDHAADCAAWGGLVEPAGPPPVADRADVVVAVVLSASGGLLGSGLGAVVRVRAAGLCACLLQAPLTRQQERTTSNTTNTSDTMPYRNHGSTSTRNSPPGARATSMSLVMSSKQASHSTATRGLDVP